jgi:hypothetical protein
MKSRIGRAYYSAGGTKCGAHDSRVSSDRAKRTGANLRAHREPHESQSAGDAAPDYDEIRIKDVKEGRNRNAQVMARCRKSAECDPITPLRLVCQTAHAEVPLRIKVTPRQPATRGQLALDQFADARCRRIRLEASTHAAIARHAGGLDCYMPELSRHSIASVHQLSPHDKATAHAGA